MDGTRRLRLFQTTFTQAAFTVVPELSESMAWVQPVSMRQARDPVSWAGGRIRDATDEVSGVVSHVRAGRPSDDILGDLTVPYVSS